MARPHLLPPEDPYADRRGALRHPVQVDSIVSTPTAVHRSVTLIDISQHGCQICRPVDLENGTTLSLSFGGFAPFEATVVWTSPSTAGLRFEQAIHPALVESVVAAAKGRRRSKSLLPGALIRRADRTQPTYSSCEVRFEIDADVASMDHIFTGNLRDLTVDGCQLSSDVALLSGTRLKLTICDTPRLAGLVRWCENDSIGVLFLNPMPEKTVDEILRSSAAAR